MTTVDEARAALFVAAVGSSVTAFGTAVDALIAAVRAEVLDGGALVVPQGGGMCHYCGEPDVEAIRKAVRAESAETLRARIEALPYRSGGYEGSRLVALNDVLDALAATPAERELGPVLPSGKLRGWMGDNRDD